MATSCKVDQIHDSLRLMPAHTNHSSKSIFLMNNLNKGPHIEDRPDQHESQYLQDEEGHLGLGSRRTATMFHGCNTLEFNDCQFTFSGGHYNRSDMHNILSRPLQGSLPLPVSSPSGSGHYRGLAILAVFACFCLLVGRWAGVSTEPTTKDPRSVWRSAIRVGNIKRPRFLEVLCEQRRESQAHYFTDEMRQGKETRDGGDTEGASWKHLRGTKRSSIP
ncbi:hypothetical protein BKA70DRAFT_1231117 [Coprinopsis sp. MPI-PUGE-AT-0042]|nr:hypothetical protein BKA70DRAFT_1231117 [Coprinopsis sp. MPI-PUGE-AT-0042]